MTRFAHDLTRVEGSEAIAEAKRRIRNTLTQIGVLDDLSAGEREQMTGEVFSATREYQVTRNRVHGPRDSVGFSNRELRRLYTRVKRLQQAFRELADEASTIDPALGDWVGDDFVAQVLDELEDRVHQLPGPDDAGVDHSSMRDVQDIRVSNSSLLVVLLWPSESPSVLHPGEWPGLRTLSGRATFKRLTNARTGSVPARS